MKLKSQLNIKHLGIHLLIAMTFLFIVAGISKSYKVAYSLQPMYYQAVKVAGNPTVYLLADSQYKIPVPSMKVLASYGISSRQIALVPKQYLDIYSDPSFIQQVGTDVIYLLQSGKKRILSSQIKKMVGPKGIFLVSAAHLKSFSSAAPVDLALAQTLAKQQVAAATTGDAESAQCQPDPRTGGENGCLIYQAIRDNNPQECFSIKDKTWQMTCWLSFDPGDSNPLQYCSNVDSSFYNDCVVSVAARKKNLSLCGQISGAANNPKKIECLAGVGLANGDYTGCLQLPPYSTDLKSVSKDSCLYEFAMLKGRADVCSQIDLRSPYSTSCVALASQLSSVWQESSNQ